MVAAVPLLLQLVALFFISTAASTLDLGTFTPLEDSDSVTATATAVVSFPSSSPGTCIDYCFNNATGSGRQGGCAGISGQYECICAFPAMMQTFETCLSSTCALDSNTIQQTLANVQQVCASCGPNGCNAFTINAPVTPGETTTRTVQPSSTNLAPPSVCFTTTQSATASAGSGGIFGTGFISVGTVPCPTSAPTSSSLPAASLSKAAASSGGTAATDDTSAASPCRTKRVSSWRLGLLAASLLTIMMGVSVV
ncbi:hypothetical protein C8R46DRAFT_1186731 [Mycena filopes]|nr:hypothetical protein C8R46DRAFT_1186731 [Mycena filopes]